MKKLAILTAVIAAALLTGCVAQSVPRTTAARIHAEHNITGTNVTSSLTIEKLSNPKNTDIKVNPATGEVTISTVMDPAVITTTGDAQAKLVTAGGDVAVKVLANLPK